MWFLLLTYGSLADRLDRRGEVNPRFTDLYNRLRCIRNQLEKLTLTQAWSLRETDLYSYQRDLDRIDETRVNGNFLDADGNPADLHAQRVSETPESQAPLC